ncbi:tetratricopeptide repeat protein [Methylocaldum sp. MU1018]
MRWVRPLALAAGAALTAGCGMIPWISVPDIGGENPQAVVQDPPRGEPPFTPPEACGGTLSPEQRMYLDLVYEMVKQGQYYAALAHLDQLEKKASSAPQNVYLRAESLRGIGRPERAAKLYRSLLDGCMAGYSLHGLGLLAAAAGRLDEAEDFLMRAGRERPASADVRNDLGMVLLLAGRRDAARQEFLTAAELDRKDPLPVENLIVLMLMDDNPREAKRVAERRGLSEQDLERLALRARRLAERSEPGDSSVSPSSPAQE